MNKARKEAEDLLQGVNRKIENTIRIIRETQAEKEKTKQAREELAALSKKIEVKQKEEDRRLDRKIEQLKRKEMNRQKRTREKIQPEVASNLQEKDKPVGVGDKVKMKGQEITGEVMEVQGGKLLVAFGNMITLLPVKSVKRISHREFRQNSVEKRQGNSYMEEIQKRKLRFSPNIDVRGKRAEEALQIVQDFVDEAIVTGEKDLTILHGKGNGVLRQLIREYLGSVDVVSSYHDEHPDRGGPGITLVKLDF